MTKKCEISEQTNDQNSHINDQMTILVANFWSIITKHTTILMKKHMTRLMTKHMTRLMTKYEKKLMTTRQAINDQIIYDPIFCRMIRDLKLATKDHQMKSGHLYAYFGHLSIIMY